MLIRTVYTVDPGSSALEGLNLPFELALEDEGVRVALAASGESVTMTLERTVRPDELEVVEDSGLLRENADGQLEPMPTLRVAGTRGSESVIANDVLSAITFLTDIPFSLSRRMREDRVVAETPEEQVGLDRLGTDDLYVELSGAFAIRTFDVKVEPEAVKALLSRSTGLRLYADAMKLSLTVARYRELWRVLESAFGRKDDKLIQLLEAYPPALQIGFSAEELKRMHTLRGRASHAESKVGYSELIAVERECRDKVWRLKNLVERVILTKKHWGLPTVGLHELARVQGYVMGDGNGVVYRKGT